MKAAVFYGPGNIRVEEVSKPSLEDGDILIKVRACGICGSDLHAYKLGLFPELGAPINSGMILGHEFSGDVIEIVGKAESLRVGDRVTGLGTGAEAEYLKIPSFLASVLFHIPPEISYEEAATAEPLATSVHTADITSPADGETIVILGAGIIGLGVLQVLKTMSSLKVVMVDLSDKRLATAQKLGADVIINAAREEPYKKMLEMTGSTKLVFVDDLASGVDTVIDCAGYGMEQKGLPPLQQALLMVKSRGKVLLVANYEKPVPINGNLVMNKALTIIGSFADTTIVDDFARGLELIKSRKIDRKPLITHRFPLDKAKEAYETQLRAGEAIKVMITP